jgi:hypothetical protein
MLHAALSKVAAKVCHVPIIQQCRMHGGANFIRHAGFEYLLQTGQRTLAAAGYAGDAGVIRKRRFHIQPHPVDQRQHRRQMLRIGAAGVQADLESERTHFAHGVDQACL